VKSLVVDLGNVIEETFVTAASAVGTFFGELATGEATAGDFLSVIGSVFADMAITVGKIIIAAAVAKMALDAALTTFGGAGIALAAGIALVTIGSAVKGALKSAASGGGGSASVSSSSGSGGGAGFFNTAPNTVQKFELMGEFKVKGSDLVYILNKEAFRKRNAT
jgi:hypothetical protein